MLEPSALQRDIDFLGGLPLRIVEAKEKITDSDLKDADLKAVRKHTRVYSDYLETFVDEYKKKARSQRIMKIWFFVLTILLLFVIIGGGVWSIIIVSAKENISPSDVATVITAVVGSVSSFLILPKVIAENLFPSKEEDKTAEIFSKMFEHDINIRNIYSNAVRDQSPETKEDV